MSMKKSILGLAAMAVAVSMASCSLDEVMEQPAQQAIGFSSFVGKATKAATEIIMPNGTASAEQSTLTKFYVFGKYGASTGTYDTEVYNNAEVAVSNSSYQNVSPSVVKYWVPSKIYMFAAYSNGNNQIANNIAFGNDGHITITDYEAGDNDLILATPLEEPTQATIASQPNAVELEFKHLLSQVAFQFKNGFTNGYKVKIENLQFSVDKKATYSFDSNENTYKWSEPTAGTTTNETYTINSGNVFAGGQEIEATQLSSYEFVIPQSNADIKATFKVTVYESDGKTVVYTKEYKTDDNTAVSLATGMTTTPGSDNDVWTAGYKYKYTAEIKGDVLGLFPIQFTVTSFKGWENATGNPDLDLN